MEEALVGAAAGIIKKMKKKEAEELDAVMKVLAPGNCVSLLVTEHIRG